MNVAITTVCLSVCISESAAMAWTLAAADMVDDLDIIDSDTVLDADDLKKPDPASLRSILAGFYMRQHVVLSAY